MNDVAVITRDEELEVVKTAYFLEDRITTLKKERDALKRNRPQKPAEPKKPTERTTKASHIPYPSITLPNNTYQQVQLPPFWKRGVYVLGAGTALVFLSFLSIGVFPMAYTIISLLGAVGWYVGIAILIKDGIHNSKLIGKTIYNTDSNISTSSFTVPSSGWSDSYTSASTQESSKSDGVYYNYYAATAGTISGSSNAATAQYDICPKGWHIPSGTQSTSMFKAEGITNYATASIAPYNFIYNGYSYGNGNLDHTADSVFVWLTDAYNATIRNTIYIYSSSAHPSSGKQVLANYGVAIRCMTQ